MRRYSLSHLADHVLVQSLRAVAARNHATTAELLALIAEVDARPLYLPAAYPSMFAFCVGELHLSEARKRIHAARAARSFPAILPAVAQGRLSLSAVVTLAPHLSPANSDELLAVAIHKTRFEIQELIAERFPRLDVPTQLVPLASPASATPQATPSPGPRAPQRAPGRVDSPDSRTKLEPIAPGRAALHVTLEPDMCELLRYAQALLGDELPSREVREVLRRALQALVEKLERRKFAATARPRKGRGVRLVGARRYVPAAVKRSVWERDGGRCTFESVAGRRCPARERLEFDHVVPVARGSEATVEGMRLRCRAHNQFEAERVFGAGFMEAKREAARHRAEVARKRRATKTGDTRRHAPPATRLSPEPDPDRDVRPWLRALGCRVDEARHWAELCEETMPEAPIEQKVRFALEKIGQRLARKIAPAVAGTA